MTEYTKLNDTNYFRQRWQEALERVKELEREINLVLHPTIEGQIAQLKLADALYSAAASVLSEEGVIEAISCYSMGVVLEEHMKAYRDAREPKQEALADVCGKEKPG